MTRTVALLCLLFTLPACCWAGLHFDVIPDPADDLPANLDAPVTVVAPVSAMSSPIVAPSVSTVPLTPSSAATTTVPVGTAGPPPLAAPPAVPGAPRKRPFTLLVYDVTGHAILEGAIVGAEEVAGTATCGVDERPPKIGWLWLPRNAQTIAIIISDLDAPDRPARVHWLRYGIDAAGQRFGTFPHAGDASRGVTGVNEAAATGFLGLCADVRYHTHHVRIDLYASDAAPDELPPDMDQEAFLALSRDHLVGHASVSFTLGLYD